MSQEIIIEPILSEKSAALQESQRKYAFKVLKSANKIDIKKVVESRFGVKVEKVATMNIDGKLKQMTTRSNGKSIRTQGKRSSYKKAIVTLVNGDAIDYVNSGAED